MNATIKLVIFDLDGTLINSMPQYAKIASQLLQKYYGLEHAIAEKEYYRTSGIPFSQQLETLFPNNAHNNEVAEKFEQEKNEYLKHHGFDLAPTTYRALTHLQDAGYLLAISTSNTPESLESITSSWHFQFDAALGYEGENFQKGRTHFTWLAKHFDVTLNEILYVADSLEDYRLAKEANVKFIAVLGTFTREDFAKLDPTIKCLADIADIEKFLI